MLILQYLFLLISPTNEFFSIPRGVLWIGQRTYQGKLFAAFCRITCEPFEDCDALKALEVVDEDIWDPEIFQELQTDGVPRVRFYRVVGGYSSFLPFHRKIPENEKLKMFNPVYGKGNRTIADLRNGETDIISYSTPIFASINS